MCDTVAIVRPDAVLFAKNSDRDANEAQVLEWHPPRNHESGSRVRCTWTEIPQAAHTHAVLISRPVWMWGAEIGANECGVAIGNEAVFTNQPYAKTGLTGMDLVRLALERGETAQEACETIAALLERHGQGGGCGYENRSFTYHNSFLVADPARAFVLETAGRQWAVEEVQGARTISNGLTIRGFAERHSDFLYTRVSACRTRQARTQALASECASVGGLFALLRDHGEGCPYPRYAWSNGGMRAPCMHAGGLLAASQTTASWVSELASGACRHWATGTSAPCISLFKPVAVDQPLDLGEPGAYWRRHERLHRHVMRDPAALMPLFAPERDAVEAAWLADPPEPQSAWEEAQRLLERWTDAVTGRSVPDCRPFPARRYWARRTSM